MPSINNDYIRLLLILFIGIGLCDKGYAQQLNVVTDNAPPLQFIKNGKVQGPTTEIVKATFKHANIITDIQMYPWARSYEIAKSNSDTLIYPLIRTPERENQFTWIGPLLTMKLGFIKLKNHDSVIIDTLNDAKKYKLGAMRGDFTHNYLNNNGFIDSVNYELFPSIPELLQLLYAKKIDIFIADISLLKTTATDKGYDATMLVTEYLLPEQQYDLYLAANKKLGKATVKRLQESLSHVTQQKTLR